MADEFMKAALYGIKTFNKKAKEKIGMIKLIELLNEYETPRSGVVFKSYDDYDGIFYGVDIDGETEIAWSDSYICGKGFGWVKWLVENDKIDLKKLPRHLQWEGVNTDIKGEELVIMVLSIQDEPIRFLCEIIK